MARTVPISAPWRAQDWRDRSKVSCRACSSPCTPMAIGPAGTFPLSIVLANDARGDGCYRWMG
jgi:hypothetical protein